MYTAKKIIRSIAVIASVVLCCFYINGALFSFWAASGPPTEYPESFLQQGVFRFNIAIILGIVAFLVTRSWQQIKSSKVIKVLIIICFICALYPFARKYILIDKCLDNGGVWSYEYFQCEN